MLSGLFAARLRSEDEGKHEALKGRRPCVGVGRNTIELPRDAFVSCRHLQLWPLIELLRDAFVALAARVVFYFDSFCASLGLRSHEMLQHCVGTCFAKPSVRMRQMLQAVIANSHSLSSFFLVLLLAQATIMSASINLRRLELQSGIVPSFLCCYCPKIT